MALLIGQTRRLPDNTAEYLVLQLNGSIRKCRSGADEHRLFIPQYR